MPRLLTMKRVRVAMLLYVAVGLIPLAALSRFTWPRIEKEYQTEIGMYHLRAIQESEESWKRSQNALEDFLRIELAREFTEFQHWRAPLNTQSQAPSVVRSGLASKPANSLVKFYFQVRSSGSGLSFSTPHQADEQNEQLETYQTARPLTAEFLDTLRQGKESILAELRTILAAPVDGKIASAQVDQDLVTAFMQARSGEKPASLQLVSNEVLLVNSNSQEVANQARTAKINKQSSRTESVGDPWSGLKRPPGIDDPYGDSLVQVFPFLVYVRSGSASKMVFWRTVRTPAEQILQGFEIDLEYVRLSWGNTYFGGSFLLGSTFKEVPRAAPQNVPIESKTEGPRAAWLGAMLGMPEMRSFDGRAHDERFARTRDTYMFIGLCYLALLSILGFSLYRTVSRSEALAKQQGEFVAAVSHELRTPLTSMRLFTELLIGQAKASKNEKVEQHASRILAEEERLTRLVEMILLSARIERGSFKLELVQAPLIEPLNAAIEMAQRAHSGREITVEVKELPQVRLDRAAAQQVFFNLIDNALKYSREAGKPVRITGETKEGELILKIIDQGVGIAQPDQKQLFNRFYRGQKASEHGAGTGLGLWLCREYARQMGWEIKVESAQGQGTCVSVRLPIN